MLGAGLRYIMIANEVCPQLSDNFSLDQSQNLAGGQAITDLMDKGKRAMMSPAQFRINGPNIIHETIDNEVIIINLKTGIYYSLEKAGADIWNLIADNKGLGEIVEELTRRYGGRADAVESTVRRLVIDLQAEGLISEAGMGDSTAASGANEPVEEATPAGLSFETPVLQKYTDMQEFILLDPIHEVDETGWPNPSSVSEV